MKYTCLIVLEARDVLMSLRHPGDVSEEVVEYVAAQLDVAAASMATYTEREKMRLEHQWEIARQVGYRDFVDVEAELAVWVDDRAWTTGEGPVAVFNGAVGLAWRARGAAARVTTLAWLRCGSLRPRTLQHLSTARSAQSPRLRVRRFSRW
jgi:hypothetical protein